MPERKRQQRGRSLRECEEHARRDAHGDRAAAPEKRREQPDEHQLAHPYPAGGEQGQQAENVAQRERPDSRGEREGSVVDEPAGEHPQGRAVRAPAEHREQGAGEDGGRGERLQRGHRAHQAAQPDRGGAPDEHQNSGEGREAGESETERRRAVRGHGGNHGHAATERHRLDHERGCRGWAGRDAGPLGQHHQAGDAPYLPGDVAAEVGHAPGAGGRAERDALTPACQDAAPGLDLHQVGQEHQDHGARDPRRRDRQGDVERAKLRPVTCERPDDEGHDRQRDQALDRPEPAPSDQVFTNL